MRSDNDTLLYSLWTIFVLVAIVLMGYGWALGAERTHPVSKMPLIPALPPDRIQELERWKEIARWIEDKISRLEAYDDSTFEVVDYGTVKLVSGQMGVRLRRNYTSGYLAMGFDRGQTYVEGGLTVTHRIGVVPIDSDSIVVRAYKATGEIATNDTSTVGYWIGKADR